MKELNMRRPTQCVNYIEKLVSGLEEELDVSKQCQLLQSYIRWRIDFLGGDFVDNRKPFETVLVLHDTLLEIHPNRLFP